MIYTNPELIDIDPRRAVSDTGTFYVDHAALELLLDHFEALERGDVWATECALKGLAVHLTEQAGREERSGRTATFAALEGAAGLARGLAFTR